MRDLETYVEPLFAYVTRKYLDPSLAMLPLVAAIVANAALLGGVAPPPSWALVYVNAVTLGSFAALLIAVRNRFERRRFKIEEDSIALPSIVKIDGSSLESLQRSSIMWARGVEGELSMLWWRRQTLTGVEIKTRHRGEELILVWPTKAFGRRNLDTLLRVVPVGGPLA